MKNLKKINTILFDFGGTLDTNGVHWSEKFWDVYKKFNLPINYETFREAYIVTEPQVQNFISKNDNLFSTLKTQITLQFSFLDKKKMEFTKHPDNLINSLTSSCYNDVLGNISDIKPILNMLKLNVSLGLVSNFYGNVKSVCEDLKIDSYFNVIVDSTEIKISKPDPRIFETAIDLLNTNAKSTIVIGDSYDRDILPAKKLGCQTIWLKGKSWKKEDNTNAADLIIHSLFDLEKYL